MVGTWVAAAMSSVLTKAQSGRSRHLGNAPKGVFTRAGPRSVQLAFPHHVRQTSLIALSAWDAKKRGSITARPGPPGGPLESRPSGSIFDVVTVMFGALRTDNDIKIWTMTEVMITGFAGNTATL